jgi:hypothetical protein
LQGGLLAKLLKGSHSSIVLNEHFDEDGEIVFSEACKLGCEGIVSKRLGSPYRSGRSPHSCDEHELYFRPLPSTFVPVDGSAGFGNETKR